MESSFLENVNQMIVDAAIQEIQDQLFDNWVNENSNEGQFFADMRFAEMSGDTYIMGEFNKFYNLTEKDDNYLC
jgi:hypothetical protein